MALLAQTVMFNTQDHFANFVRLDIISIPFFHLSALRARSSALDANNASMEWIAMFA